MVSLWRGFGVGVVGGLIHILDNCNWKLALVQEFFYDLSRFDWRLPLAEILHQKYIKKMKKPVLLGEIGLMIRLSDLSVKCSPLCNGFYPDSLGFVPANQVSSQTKRKNPIAKSEALVIKCAKCKGL